MGDESMYSWLLSPPLGGVRGGTKLATKNTKQNIHARAKPARRCVGGRRYKPSPSPSQREGNKVRTCAPNGIGWNATHPTSTLPSFLTAPPHGNHDLLSDRFAT